MVQEKPCSRLLPCFRCKHRIATSSPHALHCVSSTGGADCGNAPAIFLDDRHPWSPKAARFRAHLLFSLPRSRLFLWILAAGFERATLLLKHPHVVGHLCVDCLAFGTLVLTLAVGSFAHRIRTNPGVAPSGRPKEDMANRGLRACSVVAALAIRRVTVEERFRFRAAKQFLGMAISGLVGGWAVHRGRLAVAIRESGPRPPTKFLSPNSML